MGPRRSSNKSAVVGVGTSKFVANARVSPFIMAIRALKDALPDASISKSQIDGLIMNTGPPHGVDYDVFARGAGLDIRFASQTKAHGRFSGSILQHAAMAVGEDLASFVACIGSRDGIPVRGLNMGIRRRNGTSNMARIWKCP